MTLMNHAELKRILRYDPDTGEWTWLDTMNSRVRAESRAGYRRGRHWSIGYEGEIYRSSRLAWFYTTGEWPKHEIDHINGNCLDDRWENLRERP